MNTAVVERGAILIYGYDNEIAAKIQANRQADRIPSRQSGDVHILFTPSLQYHYTEGKMTKVYSFPYTLLRP